MSSSPVQPLDPALYTRAPIITIASGLSLADTLVASCPKVMPAHVKKACKKLKETAESARAAWTEQHREAGQVADTDGRDLDQEADTTCWALRMRVAACALLPAARYPLATRAAEINATLFGAEGLEFTKKPYVIQLQAMKRLLQRIDEDGLQKDIDTIAGPDYLAQLRHVVPRYEQMVQGMFKRSDPEGATLLDHTRALQRSIVDYATKLCGLADEDEPATITMGREALRPIEVHRAMFPRAGGSTRGADQGAPAEGDAAEAKTEGASGDGGKPKPQ